jgi:starvation-inducible outer membrane lipoprotein
VVVIEPLISGIPPEIKAETDIRLVADLEGFWEILDLLNR